MNWGIDEIQLQGESVCIRTYRDQDIARISQAVHDPQGWHALQWGWTTPQAIAIHLQKIVESHGRGESHPLIISVNDECAGICRFMRLDSVSGSLEIGGTSIVPKFRRSFVNSEAKLKLLTYAFEVLNCERVEFRVDCMNYASQIAVLRLGALFEGRQRRRQRLPNGEMHDGFTYSIIRPDWPSTQEHLSQLLRSVYSKTKASRETSAAASAESAAHSVIDSDLNMAAVVSGLAKSATNVYSSVGSVGSVERKKAAGEAEKTNRQGFRLPARKGSRFLESDIRRTGIIGTKLAGPIFTMRLEIRPVRLHEDKIFLSFVKANRAELRIDFPQAGQVMDLNDVAKNFAHKAHAAASGEAFHYGIWLRAKNQLEGPSLLVGLIHIKDLDLQIQSAEIGYFIEPARRRQGFASEALSRLIEVLQKDVGASRVVARVRPENTASQELLRKLTFYLEGRLQKVFLLPDGSLSDLDVFTLITACTSAPVCC